MCVYIYIYRERERTHMIEYVADIWRPSGVIPDAPQSVLFADTGRIQITRSLRLSLKVSMKSSVIIDGILWMGRTRDN